MIIIAIQCKIIYVEHIFLIIFCIYLLYGKNMGIYVVDVLIKFFEPLKKKLIPVKTLKNYSVRLKKNTVPTSQDFDFFEKSL